jgi:DNA end-binding protein Ku
MPRPIWTGSIAFGLVNVPVKLFSATESHRLAFHELEKGTGERVRYRRVAESSGHEVPWENIEKGFEVAKDRFVVLTDEELASAAPEKTHAIDIEQFVPLADIDPLLWDQSYYAAPDGASAAKAYVLLREAMRKDARVAVGRFVMRTKEYVVCVRPLGQALALHTMFFADEVRDVKDVVKLPPAATVTARELAMAGQLIATLAAPWDPRAHEDTFKERVLAVVKKKGDGQTIDTGEGAQKAPKIVDLMEALKATLAQGADGKPKASSKPKPAAVARRGPARSRTATRAPRTRAVRAPTRKQGGSR